MAAAIQARRLNKLFRRRVRAEGMRGLVASYMRPAYETVHAVRDLDLRMEPGESLALIGPNGAGKSTTIKMLTGIVHPTSGEATVLGIVPWKDRKRLAMNVGTVFGQRSQLWFHLPAGETFALLARIYEIPDAEYRARRADLVRRFALEPLLGTAVRKLSLGERMRCEIAASLLHRPRILFLDEPTIGLDVVVKQRIRDLILVLNQQEGATIFLTSHDAGDVEVLCKRAMVINHGEVIFDERVATLKRDFIQSKTISLKLAEPWQGIDRTGQDSVPGVQVLKHKGYGVKLQVDTNIAPIEGVIGRLLASYSVADINVDHPPMEEIIARIYESEA